MLGVADVLLEQVGRHHLVVCYAIALALDSTRQRSILIGHVVTHLSLLIASLRVLLVRIRLLADRGRLTIDHACATDAHRVEITSPISHLSGGLS